MSTFPSYPFGDTANAVLNTARSRVGDLILTPGGSPTGADPGQQLTQVGGGTLLAELNPDGSLCLRTQIIFNSAYRKFQKYLANLGFRLMVGNQIIESLPANANADAAVQTWLSWNGTGLSDGSGFSATPALPSLLYAPLAIRERTHGTTAFGPWMTVALNGLLNVPRVTQNYQWEWRDNSLWFPGASAATDLQIRYRSYLPDLVATGSPATPWYYQIVPVPGCLSALAWYVAIEVCFPRGDEQGYQSALAMAEDEADKVFNDQAFADQRTKPINDSYARPGVAPQNAPQQAVKA